MQLGNAGHLPAAFATAMQRLGPFGPAPLVAVAVSGGADSTALALLAQGWVSDHQGRLLALIVDHGLRPESAAEAALTAARLSVFDIASQILTLKNLAAGAGLQERARTARHAALANACRAAGALFLLLGHHAADQSETVTMRAARGAHGLEAMAAWSARSDILLMRPLLGIAPARLRSYLRGRGVPWVEDPSNTSDRFERVRARQAGTAVAADATARVANDHDTASFLAASVTFRPEGFAVIHADAAPARALGALLRTVGGATYAPNLARTATLAAALRPATLGGVMLRKTSKFGGGWLLAREVAACAPPVPASPGAIWDGRYRLLAGRQSGMVGALGPDAAAFRKSTDLPAIILEASPCLRRGGEITYPASVIFTPPFPASPHPFCA